MAAITKLSQKTGIKYRVTINMAGVRQFSRNFKTKKTAVAWAKKTEGDLELARVSANDVLLLPGAHLSRPDDLNGC